MKAQRFFSMSYDIRNHPKIAMLKANAGGIAAFGRWVALMGILYDSGGAFPVDSPARRAYLVRELELQDDSALTAFLDVCADCELISRELLGAGSIASAGICDQLEYFRQKSEAGRKGNEARWGKRKKAANRTSD